MMTEVDDKKKNDLQRRMTLRRMNSFQKQPELNFIDSSMMYNLLLRGIQQKTKNSFLIYDFCISENTNTDDVLSFGGDNVIKMRDYPDIKGIFENGGEKVCLKDFQKLLPKNQEELFGRRMRLYNFIVVGSSNESQAVNLFQSALRTFEQTDYQEHKEKMSSDPNSLGKLLANCGLQKVNEKQFLQVLDNAMGVLPEKYAQEELAIRQAITLASALRINKVKEILILRHSTSHFFRHYPFISPFLKKINNSSASGITLPNEVLCGRFFYGNWKHAASPEVFKMAGITHVVNMTQEVENYFQSDPEMKVKYLKIDVEDVDTADIAQHFKKAFDFLHEALAINNSKVFVHCAQGKSRSASIVCVFFMRLFGWSFESALKYVADRREIACPNPGFVEQLRQFEQQNFKFKDEQQQIGAKINNNLNKMYVPDTIQEAGDSTKEDHEISEEETNKKNGHEGELIKQAKQNQGQDNKEVEKQTLLEDCCKRKQSREKKFISQTSVKSMESSNNSSCSSISGSNSDLSEEAMLRSRPWRFGFVEEFLKDEQIQLDGQDQKNADNSDSSVSSESLSDKDENECLDTLDNVCRLSQAKYQNQQESLTQQKAS